MDLDLLGRLDALPVRREHALILALAVALAMAAWSGVKAFGSRRPAAPRALRVVRTKFDSSAMADPLAQMEAVSRCAYERVPLLNKEEARLLPLLERIVRDAGHGHRLMAQTSLGELIRPVESVGSDETRRRGYASVNSKRLDFAIVNRFGYLIAAIEYQGSGHYHAQSFMRDAVKREALRKA